MRLSDAVARGTAGHRCVDRLESQEGPCHPAGPLTRRNLSMKPGCIRQESMRITSTFLFPLVILLALHGCGGRHDRAIYTNTSGYPVGYLERGVASWYGP